MISGTHTYNGAADQLVTTVYDGDNITAGVFCFRLAVLRCCVGDDWKLRLYAGGGAVIGTFSLLSGGTQFQTDFDSFGFGVVTRTSVEKIELRVDGSTCTVGEEADYKFCLTLSDAANFSLGGISEPNPVNCVCSGDCDNTQLSYVTLA